MNDLLQKLADQCRTEYHDGHGGFIEQFDEEKFAELIVRECIQVAANQRNPSNLNYKPSERFVEDLKLHFGVAE